MIFIRRDKITRTEDKPGEYAGIIVHDETGERVGLGSQNKAVGKKEAHAKQAIKYQTDSAYYATYVPNALELGRAMHEELREISMTQGGLPYGEKDRSKNYYGDKYTGEDILDKEKEIKEYNEFIKHLKVVKIGKE